MIGNFLLCLSFPTQIPPVLFLFINNPEKDPKVSISLNAIFVASACVVPDKYRKEIESKCFKFIWEGKLDKVKRNTMIGNFEMGGLNMIDIGSQNIHPMF
jgi:hypothetical protein